MATSTEHTDLEKDKSFEGTGENDGSDREEEKGDSQDPNLVEWEADDPENPMNWGVKRRWLYTASLGFVTLVVTFASSVFSTATMVVSKKFGVSDEVTTLGTSLFVLGFAFGPILWGPFSEVFGRKPPLYTGYFIFAVFNIGVAVAQNLYTIMICRFFGGFFASAPLAVIGGYIADMWDPVNRGIAVTVFAAATFIGPVTGPIVGGFITMSHLGWRWTQYITTIMAFCFGGIAIFLVPETFAPILLQRKAKKLRFKTKNWAIHSELDTIEISPRELATKYIVRPFEMLIKEPILLLITLYMSFIYGIIYLLFEAFPESYQMERKLNLGVGALPFIAIIIGVLCGGAIIIWHSETRFARRLREEGSVPAEERLIPMMVGSVALPIGLFWFAWTSFPTITLWPQIISGIPLGIGFLTIFLQGFNYIIDTYLMYSNSAIAANTFFRSWVGAGFPLIALPMYKNLGVRWATSLLGFLSVAMIPIPIIFYIYGPRIRKLSKFNQNL